MRAKRAPRRARKPKETTAPNPLLPLIVRVLDAKKAGDLLVVDVRQQSGITDYLVLGTGTSEPHLRALRVELEKTLDQNRIPIVGMDAAKGSGWVVIDAFDVMVHLFTPENRRRYRLDLLWKDGKIVPLEQLL